MKKREFSAQIVPNFMNSWLKAVAEDSKYAVSDAMDDYGDQDLVDLHDRISGKIVTMVENSYPYGENDFFEKEDNNFVMHKSLFTEL